MTTEVEAEWHSSLIKDTLLNESDHSLEDWRKDIRARVTALKCHIMASHGLSPEGLIKEPYSPDILLKIEHNAQYVKNSSKENLQKYIEKAIERLPSSCHNSKKSDIKLDDVKFSLGSETETSNSTPPSSPVEGIPTLSLHNASGGATALTVSDNLPNKDIRKAKSCDNVISDSKDEVVAIRKELRVKEDEVIKLSRIRDEVESELQELTANLFQEAHGMVLEANQRAASAEKSLKEANMQVEMLQAEVVALKALVITSTPSSPNPHLHPQIISKGAQAIVSEAGKIFHRGHRKSPSDFDLKYGRDTTPPSSPLKEYKLSDPHGLSNGFPLDPECWEVDPVVHKEFVCWRQEPVLSRDDPFMARVYVEDIDLCLSFPNSTLAFKVQRAIEDNALYIEEVNPRQKNSCPKKCVLLDVPRYCKYRFRLGEKDDTWYYISQLARNRIIAVCDFLNYLRYIQLGLVKSSIHDVYWEIVKRRRQMSMARLGF